MIKTPNRRNIFNTENTVILIKTSAATLNVFKVNDKNTTCSKCSTMLSSAMTSIKVDLVSLPLTLSTFPKHPGY